MPKNPTNFVHLNVHSEYSLLDSACRIPALAKRAAELKMLALALTDHGNLFGAIQFYKECLAHGIKPIIGCEVYLAPGSRLERKSSHRKEAVTQFLLLAKNETGYKNLVKLVSAAHLEGMYHKPSIDKEILSQYSEGLIGIGVFAGEVARHIRAGCEKEAKQSIASFKGMFAPGDFYLEIADHGLPQERRLAVGILKYGKQIGVKVVTTNDVHYLRKEHAAAHDMRLCIQAGVKINDEKRLRYPTPEFYLKSTEEMGSLFAEVPGVLATTLEIAEKCNLNIELGQNKFPAYIVPESETREGYLRRLCEEGMVRRFGAGADAPDLRQRLDYELGILSENNFTSYFLIVWDYIDYAKRSGIPVGPGRGSAAGSFIAYVLGITDLNPLHYGLIFERFLNPENASSPDIDFDFCHSRRSEVIEYLRGKYGQKSVAHIITFGTTGPKLAVRDVGNAMGISYCEADRLAKMIPFDPKMTLEEALLKSTDFKWAYDEVPVSRQIIDAAMMLEGIVRQAGVHAAGIVISDHDLTDDVPLTVDDHGGLVTQYAMKPLGELGLLTMDFLGLRILTVIQDSLNLIEQSTGTRMVPHDIPLDDPASFDLLCRAQNIGLFQVESPGMCKACLSVQPRVLEDVIAIGALYRPGTLAFIQLYSERKAGRLATEYDHPLLEPILKETYGIVVYEEQVMQAAHIVAGYTLGGADLLRRAMRKKMPEKIIKHRKIFVQGCATKNKIGSKKASQLFDLLNKFAGSSFSKAHAACYGVITCQTAFLKARYPAQFMSALLSNERDNTEKAALILSEAKAMGVSL